MESAIDISLLFAFPSLIAAGVVFVIGGLVLLRNPRNTLNLIFFLFCMSISYWGFEEFQLLQANSVAEASFWLRAGALWPIAVSFLLHFTLIFTNNRLLKYKLTYLLIYGPTLLAIYLWMFTDNIAGQPNKVYWGWEFEPHLTLLGDISVLAVGILAIAVPLALIRSYRSQTNPFKKKEVKLVLIGFTIPVAATLLATLISSIFDITLPDLTTVSSALGVGSFIGYAIWKYELFPLTTAKAAEHIVSHMNDYMFLADSNGKIVTANQPVLNVSGYLKTEIEGQPLKEVLPGIWPPKSHNGEGESAQETSALQTKTGAQIPVSVSCSQISNPQGEPQGAVFIASDLKGSGQAQKLLRESEERYRKLVESLPEVIYTLDSHGKISSLNPAFEEITGWRRADWLGKSFIPLLHPKDLPSAILSFKHILSGEVPPVRELRIRSQSGKYMVGEFTSTPMVRGGKVIGESGVARDISDRKKYESNIRHTTEDLTLINQLNNGANVGYGMSQLFGLLSGKLKQMFNCPSSVVYLPTADKKFLTLHKSTISQTYASKIEKLTRLSISKMDIKIPLDEGGFYSSIVNEGIPRLVNDPKIIQQMISDFGKSKLIKKMASPIYHLLDVRSVIEVPFVSRGEVIGLLEMSRRRLFKKEDLNRLSLIAGEITSILVRRRTEKELEVNLEKINKAENGFIQAIAQMVESRDLYTAGHQRRVAGLARAIGREMSLPSNQIEGIYTAGFIHDLGKIHVPAEILTKPCKLTDLEMSIVRTHAQVGFNILREVAFPWPIARIVYEHHERWNGSGYPRGLKEREICLEARIISLADVAEAICSHRPYRPALGLKAAIDEISENRGILYDPDPAAACINVLSQKGFSMDEQR